MVTDRAAPRKPLPNVFQLSPPEPNLGCYGGGVLWGAATPRNDGLAAEGLRLLNFNVEAQCTPSRSAVLTGRHAIRSGTQAVPVTGELVRQVAVGEVHGGRNEVAGAEVETEHEQAGSG